MQAVSGNQPQRSESSRLFALLQRISSELIRSAQGELGRAIDGALAEMGQALSADRALIATRDANGNVVQYAWHRNGTNGRRSTSDGDPLDLALGGLQLEDTLVCDNRKGLPVALRGAKQLKISSAILVPLNGGKTEGVLALAAKSPRSWRPPARGAPPPPPPRSASQISYPPASSGWRPNRRSARSKRNASTPRPRR